MLNRKVFFTIVLSMTTFALVSYFVFYKNNLDPVEKALMTYQQEELRNFLNQNLPANIQGLPHLKEILIKNVLLKSHYQILEKRNLSINLLIVKYQTVSFTINELQKAIAFLVDFELNKKIIDFERIDKEVQAQLPENPTSSVIKEINTRFENGQLILLDGH